MISRNPPFCDCSMTYITLLDNQKTGIGCLSSEFVGHSLWHKLNSTEQQSHIKGRDDSLTHSFIYQVCDLKSPIHCLQGLMDSEQATHAFNGIKNNITIMCSKEMRVH